jgi:hypothetical protein
MKKTILYFFCITTFFSCNSSNSDKKEVVSTIAAEQLSDEELKKELKAIEIEEKAKIEAELKNRTSITFEKLIHDFGKVKPETDNRYKFKFTNTGKNPLIISDVKASCGCTTPYKPEKPILPGKSDYIDVNFHPKASQSGDISKTITVESNIEAKISELQIKAIVEN